MSEKLFDYGRNLNIDVEHLATIREMEVIPERAVYLGAVYNENTERNHQLYRLDDDVVQRRPMTGIES